MGLVYTAMWAFRHAFESGFSRSYRSLALRHLTLMLWVLSLSATGTVNPILKNGTAGSYSNSVLGFRYTPPHGLIDRTDGFQASIREEAKFAGTTKMLDALLAMSSGGDDTAASWGSVTIETYPRDAVSEPDDLKAEVQMSAWVVHSKDTSAPPKSVIISGQRFSVSLFATQEGPIRKGAVVWTTIRKGKLLSFAFAANSPEQLQKLTESMKSLEFF
jgi:hypothetical protein